MLFLRFHCTHLSLERLQLLNPVPDATYDSIRGVSGCLEGTRQEIIEEIFEWIDGNGAQPVCWLNGAAGSGKSAISRSVAHLCEKSNRLGASFFFFRGAGRRSTITHFISTIAHSMALSIPAMRPSIESALQRDNYIVHRSHEQQFRKLIFEPMRSVTLPLPMVIVIDALDECDDRQMIANFIYIVARALRDYQLPLRFFFTSQVKDHIRRVFAASPALDVTYCLSLQDFCADDDIRTFFRSRFATIYEQNYRFLSDISLPWPSESDLRRLVINSSGLFLCASTLINFVNDGSDLPHRKLQVALQSHIGLDALYTQVLQCIPHRRDFTRVFNTIFTILEPFSIMDLACLLQIRSADVIDALQGVKSIIMVPKVDEQPVLPLHPSLQDFLTTRARSRSFFISPVASHLQIAGDCLAVMTAHHGDIVYEIHALKYAARSWCHHLYSAIKERGGGVGLFAQQDGFTMNTLTDFVSGAFDPWINTVILQGRIVDIINTLDLILKVSLMHCSLYISLTISYLVK
jgi:hypothetical protein